MKLLSEVKAKAKEFQRSSIGAGFDPYHTFISVIPYLRILGIVLTLSGVHLIFFCLNLNPSIRIFVDVYFVSNLILPFSLYVILGISIYRIFPYILSIFVSQLIFIAVALVGINHRALNRYRGIENCETIWGQNFKLAEKIDNKAWRITAKIVFTPSLAVPFGRREVVRVGIYNRKFHRKFGVWLPLIGGILGALIVVYFYLGLGFVIWIGLILFLGFLLLASRIFLLSSAVGDFLTRQASSAVSSTDKMNSWLLLDVRIRDAVVAILILIDVLLAAASGRQRFIHLISQPPTLVDLNIASADTYSLTSDNLKLRMVAKTSDGLIFVSENGIDQTYFPYSAIGRISSVTK